MNNIGQVLSTLWLIWPRKNNAKKQPQKMTKPWHMGTQISEYTQRDLSNEYQHDRV